MTTITLSSARKMTNLLNGKPFHTRTYHYEDRMGNDFAIDINFKVLKDDLLVMSVEMYAPKRKVPYSLSNLMPKLDSPEIGMYMNDEIFNDILNTEEKDMEKYIETKLMPKAWDEYNNGMLDRQIMRYINSGLGVMNLRRVK